MKKKWKLVGMSSLSIFLSVLLISRLLSVEKAFAAELPPIAVTYNTDSAINGWQGVFSKYDQLTTSSLSIDVGTGNKITKAEFKRDGVTVADIPEAVDKQTWSGTKTLTGLAHDVISSKNKTAKGYYAWYRYTPTDPHGVRWYENGGSCPASPGDVFSVETENVNDYDMPKYPGCTDNELTLSGAREKEYVFANDTSTSISSTVVGDPVSLAINKDLQALVSGTGGVADGKMDSFSTTIDVNRSAQASNAESFTVHYTQSFDFEGDYVNLGAPGAKLMLYYAAFSVDVHAKTYKYPDELVVTYTSGASPSASVTPTPTSTPTPKPSGDFDILPSTINYRDPFSLKPKNFNIPSGCTYQSHEFKLTNGFSWTAPKQTSQTQELPFTYSNYPPPVSVGTVTVSMQITASCGQSDWVSHTLTVNGPEDNHPPDFRMGWFKDGDWSSITPVEEVVVGTKLMVRYIEDPNSIPPSPSDPDGDNIHVSGWDFSNNDWTGSLPGKYGFKNTDDYLDGIVMDTLGYHTIAMTMADDFGASTPKSDMVHVIPPNPIAKASCPKIVKENRPVDQALFDSSKSYSPMGRAIDHAKDEWTNKQAVYTNGTSSDITVEVSLHVWDTGSPPLKSLKPDTCTVTVQPDLPPVAKLSVPPLSIRGPSVDLFNKSYSPDGDNIASVQYKYKYDANNNGFEDDPWQNLTGTMLKATFTPSKVGKYLFSLKAEENFGQTDDTSDLPEASLTLDVINLAPSVSFNISGENNQPDMRPATTYSTDTILNNWPLFETNSTKVQRMKSWYNSNGTLFAGLGRGYERLHTYVEFDPDPEDDDYVLWTTPWSDLGLGGGGFSPYRAIKSLDAGNFSTPLLAKKTDGTYTYASFGVGTNDIYPKIVTTKDRIFYLNQNRVHAMNKADLLKADDYYNTGSDEYTDSIDWSYPNDPFAYTISPPVSSKMINGKLSKPTIEDFEVSNSTLFVITTWRYKKDGSTSYSAFSGTEVTTYDLRTGQEIGNTTATSGGYLDSYSNGGSTLMHAYRDELTIFYGNSYYQSSTQTDYQTYAVIDRNGNITEVDVPVGTRYTYKDSKKYEWECKYTKSSWFPTANGEYFGYKGAYCTSPDRYDNPAAHSDYMGTFLEKRNADLTLAWEVPLAGDYWSKGRSADTDSLNELVNENAQMIFNYQKNEIVVRSAIGINDVSTDKYVFQTVNMDSGATADFPYSFKANSATFNIDADGNYYASTTMFPRTPEGYETSYTKGAVTVNNGAGLTMASFDPEKRSGNTLEYDESKYVTQFTSLFYQYYGMYVGDGMFLSFFNTFDYCSCGGGANDSVDYVPVITKGTPTDEPLLRKPYQIGQFQSPFAIDNAEIGFTLMMGNVDVDQELAGMSFRMQDPRNRYAVETDGSTLFLAKYVGGTRTVLKSIAYPFQDDIAYRVKLKAVGSSLQVELNGVPYLSAEDSTFVSGFIGPFSDKPYVSFSDISSKEASAGSGGTWLEGYAVWEDGAAKANVKYEEKTFTDPENDPMAGAYRWSITHTAKFLNNQGTSALHGKSFTSEETSFDAVGVYDIALGASDDPHPDYLWNDMEFDSYRKAAEPFYSKLTVHRRPVAEFTVSLNADGTVTWTDTSYDPDRYDKATGSFSAPDVTGINYQTTRGILERKYYYKTPGGLYVESKLTNPAEIGEYEVGLQVKDEYGAWSYPVVASLTTAIAAPPNNPPTATLTYPTGTKDNPTLSDTAQPTIRWNQTDPDAGDIFSGYNVRIVDENGASAPSSGDADQWTDSTTQSWSVKTPLTRGGKYQVQVKVKDKVGAESPWSNIGWMVINSKPTVTITNPSGSKEQPSLISSNKRPTISWTQTDPEWNRFEHFYLEIRREDGLEGGLGSLVWSSNWYYQGITSTTNSFTLPDDLPTGEKLKARMMVTDHDVSISSDWSNTVWFKINFPPSVTITNLSSDSLNPTPVDSTPTIEWLQTDPDPNTEYSAYRILIRSEKDLMTYLDTDKVGQFTFSNTGSYEVQALLPEGVKLRAEMMVWDQDEAESPWSTPVYMVTNRPPAADFDWQPKPVREGDSVRLFSLSEDPDGTPLTFEWTIQAPDGSVQYGSSEEWSGTFGTAGTVRVWLRVSDGLAFSEAVKDIEVLPLTIQSDVYHTAEWLEHHERQGHQTGTHPKDFYSGERLQVSIVSAPAPVSEAYAWLEGTAADGEDVRLESVLTEDPEDSVKWVGELYDEKLASLTGRLPDGLYIVHFRLKYANGVVKREDIQIRIIGSIHQAVQVHRIQ